MESTKRTREYVELFNMVLLQRFRPKTGLVHLNGETHLESGSRFSDYLGYLTEIAGNLYLQIVKQIPIGAIKERGRNTSTPGFP
jgi:hypothetical protein